MAVWTDNTRYLWTGLTGLQYRKRIPCSIAQEDSARLIYGFLIESGAEPCVKNPDGKLSFSRGRSWISRLSWILPCSEKWPLQDIDVVFTPGIVEVSYHVKMGCCMIFAPNTLVTEALKLERLLLGSQKN